MTEPTPDLPPATRTTPRRTRSTRSAPPVAPATGDALGDATAATPAKTARVAPGTRARQAAGGQQPAPITLCIDVGGTGIKGASVGGDGTMLAERVKIATTYPLRPDQLVDAIEQIAGRCPPATRASIGFPGMVRSGAVLSAPHFVTKTGPGSKAVPELVTAWSGFDLSGAVDTRLGLPTRLANDADTQGLAAIRGQGLELVITLGTGIGTALFLDGELQTHLELSHHLLTRKRTYNEYVGNAAYLKVGKKKWSKRVDETVTVLKALTFFDTLYVGGGNAEHLDGGFTHAATVVPNADGIVGGSKLWDLHRVP